MIYWFYRPKIDQKQINFIRIKIRICNICIPFWRFLKKWLYFKFLNQFGGFITICLCFHFCAIWISILRMTFWFWLSSDSKKVTFYISLCDIKILLFVWYFILYLALISIKFFQFFPQLFSIHGIQVQIQNFYLFVR